MEETGYAHPSRGMKAEDRKGASPIMPKKNIAKWVLIAAGIAIAIGVFGYFKLFVWNPEHQNLAVVNGHRITVAQFERELAKVPSPFQEILKEQPIQLVEELVLREVLLQEARRQGLKSDPGEGGADGNTALIEQLLKKEVLDKIEVSEQEIEEIYRLHRAEFGEKSRKEVTPLIENFIREMKGNEKAEQYMESLKKKATIEIDEKRLQAIAVPPPATNTKEDFQKAVGSGKPVLVDFGSNDCMPCRLLRPILKDIGKEYAGRAHVLVIDIYDQKELARQYKVQVVPTLVFFDAKGKEVYRHLGALDKEAIVAKLKEIGMA
jgi:thioredoxin 1